MMEITTNYILSQVFTIFNYTFLAISYYSKNRKVVLILSFLSIVSTLIAYAFLNAWTGAALCIVAFIGNVILMLDEKINGKTDKIGKKDIVILIFIFALVIWATKLTYAGIPSLFAMIPTLIYRYSVWQKKTLIYKFCGIPVGILWIIYNAIYWSLFGVILESILLIFSIGGYILELKGIRKQEN